MSIYLDVIYVDNITHHFMLISDIWSRVAAMLPPVFLQFYFRDKQNGVQPCHHVNGCSQRKSHSDISINHTLIMSSKNKAIDKLAMQVIPFAGIFQSID